MAEGLAALPERRLGRATQRRGWLVRRMLIAADVIGLVAAFALLETIFGASDGADPVSVKTEVLLFALSLPFWLAAAGAMGLYSRDEERPEHTTVDDLFGVFQLVTMFVWLIFVGSKATGVASPVLSKWIIFWALAIGAVVIARSTARLLARRSKGYVQNTVIVGTDRVGQLIARKLLQHPEFRINVVGFVDSSPRDLRASVAHVPVIGHVDSLIDVIRRYNVDRAVIAFSRESSRELMELTRQLQALGVQVDIVPRLFEALGPNVSINSIEEVQLISVPPSTMSPGARRLKRGFDLLLASGIVLLTSPLYLAIALWIKLDSPGPVLFRQTRLGFDGLAFTMLKFRTMHDGTSHDMHRAYIERAMDSRALPEAGGLYKLDRSDSITGSGRWLRKTSLDELPQLINVLRGDMSLVGPRPCIPYETEHFKPHHFERFSVPAGITGLWQVKARGRASFGEALDMDVAYARGRSFGLDVLLLLQTPVQMFRPSGTK